MGVNSLATGIAAVQADAALEIARLPDLTVDPLALIEGALLLVCGRDGVVSVHTVQPEVREHFTAERLETLFVALTQAGALTRLQRDRRGHTFDQYRVNPDCLCQTIHDTIVARHVLEQVQAGQTGQVELVATLPDSLPLDSRIRHSILPLAAVLHRLITEAEQKILIFSPFFDQSGFDRLASALLAAASRGVIITIITRQLSDPSSINHQVLRGLTRQAAVRDLDNHLLLYEYQQLKEGRIVLASHAKALLADSRTAYIGSANLTEYWSGQ